MENSYSPGLIFGFIRQKLLLLLGTLKKVGGCNKLNFKGTFAETAIQCGNEVDKKKKKKKIEKPYLQNFSPACDDAVKRVLMVCD